MAETRTVKLDVPIQRGDNKIEEIEIRRPVAGELRGLKLSDIQEGDVQSLILLLPRISKLTKPEVEGMDITDLNNLGTEIILFFPPKEARKSL